MPNEKPSFKGFVLPVDILTYDELKVVKASLFSTFLSADLLIFTEMHKSNRLMCFLTGNR